MHREKLPGGVSQCVDDLLDHIDSIKLKIIEYVLILARIAVRDSRSKNIMYLRGVGPATASALSASIGSGHNFNNGRQLTAWLGLTPSQYGRRDKVQL